MRPAHGTCRGCPSQWRNEAPSSSAVLQKTPRVRFLQGFPLPPTQEEVSLSTSGHLRMSSEVALGRQCPRASFSNLRIWPGCSHSTRPGGHGAQTAAPESRLRSKVPTSQLCNSRGRRTHAVRACVMLGRCLVAGAAETTAQSEFESGRSPAFVNGPCALNSYHTERFDGRGSRWALKTADRSERARVWIVSIERAIAPYSTAAPRPWLAADTRVRRRQVLGKRVPPSRTNAGLCAAELA
eukprot:6551244-Prymnesium_polylepis.5